MTVLGHPELGSTLTRPDGMFDLVVNGGGAPRRRATSGAGSSPPSARSTSPGRTTARLPDVVLVPVDPQVTAIDLSAGSLQVARGSPVTDADGSRQATVLFPPGHHRGDGAPGRLPCSRSATLNVRATEYTVGDKGPEAMPAELPPTSGYTYCVELSADEALAAGATDVLFSAPLPCYVENFLGFPVGIEVPLGSYDRARGAWIPAESGRVIEVLGVTGGAADLDVDGDGVADTGAALAALSITDAERQQLAGLYSPRPEPVAGADPALHPLGLQLALRRRRTTPCRRTRTRDLDTPLDNRLLAVRQLGHRVPEPGPGRGAGRGRHRLRAALLRATGCPGTGPPTPWRSP